MTDLSAQTAGLRPSTATQTTRILDDAAPVMAVHGYAQELDAVRWRRSRLLESPATVVVVGELSSGKSSIVNALIAQPSFAPVGAKETTAVSLRFAPPTDALPQGAIRLDLDGEHRLVTREELRDWVTVDGAHTWTAAADALLGVDVGWESPELPGITIIDTPGSGGLSEHAARRALSSAERAGVLLIVTESDGRLSSSALRFLAEAAQYAGTVIIAMNKIDANRAWKEILAEDAEILRAQRFPPASFVGVSALWALEALTDAAEREGLRAISGIDALIAELKKPLARANILPDVNALAQLRALIDRATEEMSEGLRIIARPDEAKETLEERRAELEEVRRTQRGWRFRIAAGMRELHLDVTNQSRRLIADFETRWQEKVASIFGQGKTATMVLQREMADDVVAIETFIADILAVGVRRVVSELFGGARLPVPLELTADIDFDVVDKPNLRVAFDSGGRLGLIAGGAAFGMLVARPALMMGPLIGAVMFPVAAAGVVGGFVLSGRMKNVRELQQRINDHTRVIQQEIVDRLQHASSHLTIVVSEAFEETVREAEDAVQQKMRDAERAKNESASARAKRIAQHRSGLKALEELNAKAAAEFRRLRGNSGTPSGI